MRKGSRTSSPARRRGLSGTFPRAQFLCFLLKFSIRSAKRGYTPHGAINQTSIGLNKSMEEAKKVIKSTIYGFGDFMGFFAPLTY